MSDEGLVTRQAFLRGLSMGRGAHTVARMSICMVRTLGPLEKPPGSEIARQERDCTVAQPAHTLLDAALCTLVSSLGLLIPLTDLLPLLAAKEGRNVVDVLVRAKVVDNGGYDAVPLAFGRRRVVSRVSLVRPTVQFPQRGADT